MINFKKELKKADESEFEEFPILEIKLNVAHLVTKLGIDNNEDLFIKLSQKDNSHMSHVCKSSYELLIDNRNSAENDILRLLKDVREYW